MNKSRIVKLRSFTATVRSLSDLFHEDRVSVYAAQASFFVVISAVPFLSLLFALLGAILPEETIGIAEQFIPVAILEPLSDLLHEIRETPGISLLSISAVTTLWSASKGIGAVRGGVQTVYRAKRSRGFIRNRFFSLLYTLCFIAMIAAVVVILLFGDFLLNFLTQRILPADSGLGAWFNDTVTALFRFKAPIFMVVMTLFFAVMYAVIARRSSLVSRRFLRHLPGALFASLGWNVFSYAYSLYITHFSRASTLYGSLTAVCLIMLWLYFCMIILLTGAEVNKIYSIYIDEKRNGKGLSSRPQ